MDAVSSLCAEILAWVGSGPEKDDIGERLAWLAERIGAKSAAVVVRDDEGHAIETFEWPEKAADALDGLVVSAAKEKRKGASRARRDAGSRIIELGPVDGGKAVLELDLEGSKLAPDVEAALGTIIPVYRLLLARHLAETRRKRSEGRLADLADLGSEWLWETDEAGRFTYASTDLTRLGLSTDAFYGRTREEIGALEETDTNAADWKAIMQRVEQRRPFRNFFHPVSLPDGGRLWLRSSGAPRHDANGNFLGYKGVSAELTDLVEQERSATAAFERLSAILNTLPDIVFEISAEGCYTDFMTGPPDLMVGAGEQLIGRSLEDVLPPDVAALFRQALAAVLMLGSCPAVRYKLEAPAGLRQFELLGARKPAAAPGEQPTAIFIIRDVTEDARQREELLRLGRIVQAMTNMVAIVDLDGRIEWVNRAWEKRTGWTLDDVRGKDLATLVRLPDGDPSSPSEVAEAIAASRSYHGETLNVDRNGNQYWIDFNVLPLHGSDGKPVAYVSVETDITALKENKKLAAEAAEEANRMRLRLQNAIEAMPDGVIIWDENHKMVAVNLAYRQMYPEIADAVVTGVSQEEILRIGLAKNAFPSAWGREEEWLAEQWQRYEKPTIDEILRPDGHWIRRLDLLTTDGGRIAVRIDTTEERQRLAALDAANQALAEARQSLARIIESADVGTWEWDVDTGALRIGGRYAEMLGYMPEELGEPSDDMFRSLVHPDDLARLDTAEDDDFAPPPDCREPTREHELRMRHKDGSWIWILSRSAVTERFADGRHKKVVGIHLDLTDRKRLEDELIESRAFLSEVMDASISAIAVLGAKGEISYANAEAERVLGLSRSELQGRPYNDPAWHITTPEGGPMPDGDLPFRRVMDSGEAVRDMRMAIEWPDGRRRILSVNAAPHCGEDGNNLAITSFVDITEDLARAARLEQALSTAHEASRSKSTFLANMSHEIRTPLNGVLGMAEILDGLITEPRKKEMIGTIRRSGELLLNVLNEILDMSKIEAGKMVIETIPFVPAEIARNTEALHRLHAEEKGIEFDVLTNPGAERVRVGDPFRVQQILNNLLSNAIKFTEQGSVALTVSAREGKPLTIEVHDTGIGMTAEQVKRIFDSFEQAEGGTTRRFGGTGLGMAIVRSLTNLMGGEIKVTSSPGEGTRVRITLPLVEAAEGVTVDGTPPEAPNRLSLEGVRLLVADDSQTNRMVLGEMLKDTGAEIQLVTNGAEAVAEWKRLAAAGTPVDMLILDISMPVLDGKGALAEIRALGGPGSLVPAIAVTANAMSHHVTEYIMAGFDAHVPKPFRQAELLHAIATLLPERASSHD